MDLQQGYAIVPDPGKRAQVLLVPTRRITGIEDPALLAPTATNYWGLAWQARRQLQLRLKRSLDRTAIGLAVNARAGRSQEQLHIHVSCIRADVAQALEASRDRITDRWSPRDIAGGSWRVRRLAGSDLAGNDPFRMLADADPETRAHMGDQTLVVVGARFREGDGFYLLSRPTRASDDQPGHGEVLLDETCAGDRSGVDR